MFKSAIIDLLKQVVDEKYHSLIEVFVSPEVSHGDYSTNIAMVLASKLKKSPMQIAEELVEGLALKGKTLETAEVARPGYINFFLKPEAYTEVVQKVLSQKDDYGDNENLANKKIIVEFTDPNPFKEFHIGHLFSNSVGESISRLIESSGALVTRVCYQGDIGLHVAKAVWGMQELMQKDSLVLSQLTQLPLDERVAFMGKAYAHGAKFYEEDEQIKVKINMLNKRLYEKDPEFMELYQSGKQWSLEYFEAIYQKLGTNFNKVSLAQQRPDGNFFFESEMSEKGKKLVEKYTGSIFEKSKGAVIFNGEKFGLHTRVFINSLGLPTYEAKELALAPEKEKTGPYDLSLIITANEIDEYFKVLLKALAEIDKAEGTNLASKTVHISHGVVRLSTGKMSSRTGNVFTAEALLSLLENAEQAALEKVQKKETSGSKISVTDIAIAAVKYAFLKQGVGSAIIFDLERATSLDGDTGPYIQYTYARCNSVLRKATQDNSKFEIQNSKYNDEEMAIMKLLAQFPEIVETATKSYDPHFVAVYVNNLAQAFNTFYNKHAILGGAEEVKRLALTQAVALVLKKGLYLLGIKTVERM